MLWKKGHALRCVEEAIVSKDNGGETDNEWKQWKDACVKAFPTDRRSYKEFETLKSISRVIGYKDFETIVKVYQALGYEII